MVNYSEGDLHFPIDLVIISFFPPVRRALTHQSFNVFLFLQNNISILGLDRGTPPFWRMCSLLHTFQFSHRVETGVELY